MPGKGLDSVLTGGGTDAVQPGGDPEICAVPGISTQSQRKRRRNTDSALAPLATPSHAVWGSWAWEGRNGVHRGCPRDSGAPVPVPSVRGPPESGRRLQDSNAQPKAGISPRSKAVCVPGCNQTLG